MKFRTWMLAISSALLAGIAIKVAWRSSVETPQQQVRRLLSEMAYQPSDLDFGWSGRPYDQADAEMKKLGASAVPFLIESLKDPDRLVRRQAARRLDDLGDNRAVPALMNALSDPDGEVCAAAMKALMRIAPGEAVEPIIGVLNHPQWYPRWEAAHNLGTLGDRRAVAPLIRTCRNKSEVGSTREEATKALRQLGTEVSPLTD